jgi:hypothetical protein
MIHLTVVQLGELTSDFEGFRKKSLDKSLDSVYYATY